MMMTRGQLIDAVQQWRVFLMTVERRVAADPTGGASDQVVP
jgi:hypothetical protein